MLQVRGLTVEFPDGEETVRPLADFNLEGHDGELLVLVGPSGSGKTTLLSTLAGLLTPTSGSIAVAGREVLDFNAAERALYRRHTVGVVFQAFNLIPSLSARENVLVPLRLAKVPMGSARRRADELLDQVGLADRRGHRPGQLSGGQQQRVAIARAIALDPPLLLADEPTAHLDFTQVEAIIGLLRSLARPGRTVVVSTHDDRLLPRADRAVELATGAQYRPSAATTLTYAAGQIIFEQGSSGREVYVVNRGAVEIIRRDPHGVEEHVTITRAGAYFGEMGPLLGLPRSASARALVDSVVTAYDVRDFRHRAGAGERERHRDSQERISVLGRAPDREGD